MQIKFTARHFRARQDVRDHATEAVEKLGHFFDGIVSAEVVLSFERASKSVKAAEINLYVYGSVLHAVEKSDDYIKSIDAAVEKLTMQLEKYKTTLRAKDKEKVREINDKV